MIGNPIAHSRSPMIHAAFGRQTGIALQYDRLLATPETFVEVVRAFAAAGGAGMNVTLPFKEAARDVADRLTPRAQAAGAVNTLQFTDTAIVGDNTDGAGLVRDLLARSATPLRGARVLLLGAGGAARGVIEPLLAAGVTQLAVANRTVGRAHALIERVRQQRIEGAVRLLALGLDELADHGLAPDIVIHATAAGLSGASPELPDSLLAQAALAYDMGYADSRTPFLERARAAGCARLMDGLGMLVEQAAESFERWHGVRPATDVVLATLRAKPDHDRSS